MDRIRRGLLGLPFALTLKNSVLMAAMQQQTNLNQLPVNLPVPKDDGAARAISKGWRCRTSSCRRRRTAA